VKLAREEHPDIQFIQRSILEVDRVKSDLTFTKGVLIHIEPNNLSKIYDNLYKNSNRYILIAEYYNSQQVSLSYRGNKNKLFKRDFAGDLLDKYSGLKLIDYGFCYHRDTLFSQDDISWFLLEK
jgi:spore coat polysaccharide biosynthesis protein SpsF